MDADKDESPFQDWVGRHTQIDDVLRVQPARFMQATLNQEPSLVAGDELPPLWHWLYFLEAKTIDQLGRDGHPKRGGFLPPVDLPRRMWAGGRLEFEAPLILDQAVSKRSTIVSVNQKSGRTGLLCFVTVKHEIFQSGQKALTEEHDIVYREDPAPDSAPTKPTPAPSGVEFHRVVTPTPVQLFRYSALTFNGHRIHYDVDYARGVEGYEGLVFHGPLTASMLVDLACARAGKPPVRFTFRGVAPITCPSEFRLEGRQCGNVFEMWAKRGDGALAMSATAHF